MNIIMNYVSQFFKTTPIFLVFAVLVLYLQMHAHLYFPESVSFFNLSKISTMMFFQDVSILLCCFSIPAITSITIFRTDLKDLGLTFPAKKIQTMLLTLGAFLLLVPSIYLLTKYPSFSFYYIVKQSSLFELFFIILLFPIYYFAEEFFFRGFLFLGLWKRTKWHSFWITDIIFTLSHIGKPGLEILLCIPASIIFNCLTLYTKSIYPAILVHSAMGILCIIWLNFSTTCHP